MKILRKSVAAPPSQGTLTFPPAIHTSSAVMRCTVILIFLCVLSSSQADFPGSMQTMRYDEPPIDYGKDGFGGPVVALQEKLISGEVVLEFDPKFGYLPSFLKALNIPESSQLLVFSKTSLHRQLISTNTPRAVYFNDDVYVGWTQGGTLLEISSADPKNGGVFHVVEQHKTERPMILPSNRCFECHVGSKSMGVPGHMVRSFYNLENGWPEDSSGYPRISHRAEFEERWGGWYITGKMENNPTRANLPTAASVLQRKEDPDFLQNLESLDRFIETDRYLTKGSDMVAMMVLEHQTHMHNFITRMNYEARTFLAQYGHLRYLKSPIDYFVAYILFAEEEELPGSVLGNPDYQAWFEKQGPVDSKGRSLRQFNLESRLFEYPCSFLVYSEAFQEMEPKLKELVLQRMWDVLNGDEMKEPFSNIPKSRRRAIAEILVETLPDLPDYWKLEEERAAEGAD